MGTFKAIGSTRRKKAPPLRWRSSTKTELMGRATSPSAWNGRRSITKDGLALTGKAPVVQHFPMIAGIDFAGTVEQSSSELEGRRQRSSATAGAWAKRPSRRPGEKARVKGDGWWP